jgi:hypothetical protein
MGNDERKNLEIKVNLKVKKIPVEEFENVMKQYKKYMLSFEKSLRYLADEDKITYKVLDKIGDSFKFDQIHYMKFSTPEEDTLPIYSSSGQQMDPIPQQPAPQFPTQAPPLTQPQPVTQQPPQQQLAQPASPAQKEEDFTFGGAAFDASSSESGFAPPAKGPQEPAPTKATEGFSFNIPSIGEESTSSPTSEAGVSIGVDEEDRATGIAILRRKMLMELRKIRNVVEEQSGQDETF